MLGIKTEYDFNFFKNELFWEARGVFDICKRYEAMYSFLQGVKGNKYYITPTDYLMLGMPILIYSFCENATHPFFDAYNRMSFMHKVFVTITGLSFFVLFCDLLASALVELIKSPLSMLLAIPLTIVVTLVQAVKVLGEQIISCFTGKQDKSENQQAQAPSSEIQQADEDTAVLDEDNYESLKL